jgi:YD repeat-containing protein
MMLDVLHDRMSEGCLANQVETLPVIDGGPAGIQVNTSVGPLYNNFAPLHTVHNDYNSLGLLADTIDQYGGENAYTYDANGNKIETVYPNGTEMLSVYDALNRVIWSTNQFDPANLSTALTTRTVYNQLGQTIETQQYSGQLIQIGTAYLGTASVATSSVQTVDGTPDGLPSSGTPISTSQTFYDAAGNAIETISPSGLRTGTIY